MSEQTIQKEQVKKPKKVFPAPVPYSCKPRAAREVPIKLHKPVLPKTVFYIQDGKKKAKPGDPLDLKTYLQASLASTDIANIVARLKNGDTTVINVNPNGLSGDLTKLPTSINDINDFQKKFEDTYNSLPDDIKKLFKNPGDFMQAALNNQLGDIIKKNSKIGEPTPKEEKKPEPQPEPKGEPGKENE